MVSMFRREDFVLIKEFGLRFLFLFFIFYLFLFLYNIYIYIFYNGFCFVS